MDAKQSNIIPKIQPIHVDMRGENYAFSGCCRMVMDNLGEVMQDSEKRKPIVDRLRKYAANMDEVVQIITEVTMR
ncbi:hypothetical protein AGMMS49992_34130 [Clostridia bacterium]|nr:hypothetical protein AGMMS49992_34130 [Clostridia bacterium]